MRDNHDSKQQNRLGSKHKLLVPLLVTIGILIIILTPVLPRLTVRQARDHQKTILMLPMKRGEKYYLAYTHSANLSPVVDTIEWTGREMVARESLFQTFGAGIPIPADGVGKELTKTPEGYLLTGIDKVMNSFLLMTQEVPDHHILYRQQSIRLNDLAGAGKLVEFQVRRVSLVEQAAFSLLRYYSANES